MLFDEFDRDRDGQLDRAEFADLWNETEYRGTANLRLRLPVNLALFDKNRDGAISLVELESLLNQQTMRSLASGNALPPNFPGMGVKGQVEAYWRRTGVKNARPSAPLPGRPPGSPPTSRESAAANKIGNQ